MTPRDDLRALAKYAGQLAEVVVNAHRLTRAEMDHVVLTLRECEKQLLAAAQQTPQEPQTPATGSAGISACGCWFDNHQRYVCATHRFAAPQTPAPRPAEDRAHYDAHTDEWVLPDGRRISGTIARAASDLGATPR